MKKLVLLIGITFIATVMYCQQKQSALFNFINNYNKAGVVFTNQNFFSKSELAQQQADATLKEYIRLQADKIVTATFYKTKPAFIATSLTDTKGKNYALQLAQQPLNTAGDFSFAEINNTGTAKLHADEGLHYRGCIAGDSTSFAAFSIFENGNIMGLFAFNGGTYVLGRLKDSESFILYKADDVQFPRGVKCSTNDDADAYDSGANNPLAKEATTLDAPATLCKKVRLYWEMDYNLYRYNFNSNITGVQNYATGLFNQVATMYQNEGITVELSAVHIWTVQDPYRISNSTVALNDFTDRWNKLGNSFDGDLAHLISGGVTFANGSGGNGGRGFINVLCVRQAAYAYSNVWADYKLYPTYSFDVSMVTHEIGHNMGSRHTHWCGWNTGSGGSCGSIDNCYTQEASGTCTTCPTTTDINALPTGFKGTVMSYCHLSGRPGINLALGFGSLPQATIRARVAAGSCLINNNFWTGAADTLWSNAANWSCGTAPNASTDVTIQTGPVNMPVVSTAATCRKLKVLGAGVVKVKTGFNLLIAGGATAPLVAPPSAAQLYITGTATPGGMMNTGDATLPGQQLTGITSTLYEIRSIYLTGGASYLFVPQYGSFAQQYGFTGTALLNNVNGDAFKLAGSLIKAPDTNGYYYLGVDFQRARFFIKAALPKVALPDSNELYITGTATPGGWMATGASALPAQKFVRLNATTYQLASITITAGGSFLFVPRYGSYTQKYGGAGAANTNNTISDFFREQGTDLKAPAISGSYSILVDFQSGTYTFTKL